MNISLEHCTRDIMFSFYYVYPYWSDPTLIGRLRLRLVQVRRLESSQRKPFRYISLGSSQILLRQDSIYLITWTPTRILVSLEWIVNWYHCPIRFLMSHHSWTHISLWKKYWWPVSVYYGWILPRHDNIWSLIISSYGL